MAKTHKFREKPEDIERFLTEVEDNFAVKNDVDEKIVKLSTPDKSTPRNQDLKDGDVKAVDTGHASERYLYFKIGGELWKLTATKS